MSDPDLAGMTTNERLFALGVLDAFDTARAHGDLTAMRQLLESAEVDEPSITRILASH